MLARPACRPHPIFLLDLQALEAELAVPQPEPEPEPNVAALGEAIALERQRSREAQDVIVKHSQALAAACFAGGTPTTQSP